MIEATKGNIEIVEHLNEHQHSRAAAHSSRGQEVIEIIEAIVLALVAVTTAWSGYQAARWEDRRTELYGESLKLRSKAGTLASLGGQEQIYDTTTFNSWLIAKSRNDKKVMELFERRFRADYRPAFAAWVKIDPFNDSARPPGPIFMPQYHNSKTEQSETLNEQSNALLEGGTMSGAIGVRYVRVTVLLATVLLLTAIGQRFRIASVRTGLLCTAFAVLCIPLWSIFTLPRL